MTPSVGQAGAASATLGSKPARGESTLEQRAFGDLIGRGQANPRKGHAAPPLGRPATLLERDLTAEAPASDGKAETNAAEIRKDLPAGAADLAAARRTAARLALGAAHAVQSDRRADRLNIASGMNPEKDIDADDPELGAAEAWLDDECATGSFPPAAIVLNGVAAVVHLPHGRTLIRQGSTPEDRLGAATNPPVAGAVGTQADGAAPSGKRGASATTFSAGPNATAAHASTLLRRETLDRTTAQAVSPGRERSSERLTQLTGTLSARNGSHGPNATAAHASTLLRRETLDRTTAQAVSPGRERSSERLTQLTGTLSARNESHGPNAEAPAHQIAAADVDEVSGHTGRSRLEAQLSAGRTLASSASVAGQTSAAAERFPNVAITEADFAHSDPRGGPGVAAPGGIAVSAIPTTRPFAASGPAAGFAAPEGQTDAAARPQANAAREARRQATAEPSALIRSLALPARGEDNERGGAAATVAAPASGLLAPTPSSPVGTVPALAAGLASHPAWPGLSAAHPGALRTAPGHSIRLELHPAELGMVTVSMKIIGEQLSIQLSVDTEEARSRLSADADSIVKAMRSLGFDVEQVTITQSAIAPSAGQSGTAPQGEAPSRDQQAMFSGNSGDGGERAHREARHGGEGNGPAMAPVHHAVASGSGVYI